MPRLVSDESRCIGWLATVGCYARLASTVKSTAHEKPGLILSTSLGLTNLYRASRAFMYMLQRSLCPLEREMQGRKVQNVRARLGEVMMFTTCVMLYMDGL